LFKYFSLTGYVFLLVPLATILILVNCMSLDNSFINNILSFKPLVYIGSISYGLYLWHIPVFRFFKWYSNFETMPPTSTKYRF
jgi:peptidoglycan/LPS O-acetylase OafA/YrhL